MAEIRFSSDEIGRFVARFEDLPGWSRWSRRRGAHGEDVIELIDHNGQPALRIAKTAETYVATGFAEWGLTVCDSFDDLLDTLSAYRPRVDGRRAAANAHSRAA